MGTPHYLRFARALALLSVSSGLAAAGCSSGGGGCVEHSGQPCAVTGRPEGCCMCVATGDDGGPVLDGGAVGNGRWQGVCAGPLAPPSLA